MSDPPADLPRAVPLEGASNVRDLGGYPATGGHVRFGRIYRAAALAGLTEADRAVVAGLGLRTVCDFRGAAERAQAPSRLPDGTVLHALAIEPTIGASLRDIAATRAATGADARALMQRAYAAYALEWSARHRALFALLLQPERQPLLMHCSAGKDRTGFAAALLLTLLGVEWPVVVQDYLASNDLWRGDSALAAELPPEAAAALLTVRAELLEGAFAAITGAYGTFDRYAEQALGVGAEQKARLRALLVA